jgi:hypothetical protein
MKGKQIFNVINTLQALMELKLPVKSAYEIYNLAKQINDKRDFFIKEEKKIIDKFNAEVLENGSLQFKTVEDQQGFVKEHEELMNCELDDIKTVELKISELKNIELTAADIATLDGVVVFID